jgi:hypothetical protein
MKPKVSLLLGMLTVSFLIGTAGVSIQQVSAPRECPGCTAFKKLTHEFEKNVIEAATSDDSNTIPSLLEQYNQDVLDIFAICC